MLSRVPRLAVLVTIAFWTASAAAALASIYFEAPLGGPAPVWRVVWTKQVAMAGFWTALTLLALAWYRERPIQAGRVRAALLQAGGLCAGVVALYVAYSGLLVTLLSRGRFGFARGMGLALSLELVYVFAQAAQVVLATNAYYHFERLARAERARHRLEAQLATAELQVVRSQLEPHFLFNTLNSIASLVRLARPEEAVEAIGRLSALLRHVLAQAPHDLVPLRDELAMAELYLGLQRMRFGEKLDVRIDVDGVADSVHVPAMVLQPLLENAIKHGPLADAEPCAVTVSVRREADWIAIEARNRVARRPTAEGPGLGLGHLEARLAAACDGAHRFACGQVGDEFVARVAFVPAGGAA